MMDKADIIMTRDSNPEALSVMYAKGFCSSPDYMTAREAAKITNISRLFVNNNSLLSFDELRFFTGVTALKPNILQQCLYWASYCEYVSIPDNWEIVSGACVGGGSRRKRIIYGYKVKEIHDYNFYSIGNSNNPCVVICKASTPPAILATHHSSLTNDAIVIYVPDGSVPDYQADPMWGQSTKIYPLSQCPAEHLVYHDLIGGKVII